MPLVIGFLVALAATALPEPLKLRGWGSRLDGRRFRARIALGVFGGVQALV